ncbi:helix-turn-helix domain-containing protein [Parabacteroides johnsonii]|uniref:helix-turn-helix domain-containing protein n=1 Tax=Parabacteroides johnsonii TaxID=387661 RepID=UPI0011DD548F|nr:helix-turn-helix transcriptional regulator [Parabacteroides johnsonii]
MKKVRVFIERASDGNYSAYMPDDNKLSYGITGGGASIDETIKDFNAAYEGMKTHYNKAGKKFEEVSFEFIYDIPSFLAYYSNKLSLAGLEHITGVAQGQLSHYVTGRRNPSKKTVEKIQNALQAFGQELSRINLV